MTLARKDATSCRSNTTQRSICSISIFPPRWKRCGRGDGGFVFTYDAQGCVVGIEVDQASKRVCLKEIEQNDAYVVTMGEVSTVSTLAAELGVGERSIQKTIQAMRAASIEVGQQESPAHPILLTEADVLAVKRWREQHPRGRPRVAAEG